MSGDAEHGSNRANERAPFGRSLFFLTADCTSKADGLAGSGDILLPADAPRCSSPTPDRGATLLLVSWHEICLFPQERSALLSFVAHDHARGTFFARDGSRDLWSVRDGERGSSGDGSVLENGSSDPRRCACGLDASTRPSHAGQRPKTGGRPRLSYWPDAAKGREETGAPSALKRRPPLR